MFHVRSNRQNHAAVLLTVFVGFSGTLSAQERIRVGWAGASPANSPIWVVQANGYLKKQGLDAQVITLTASPIAIQAMLAGELDVIVTSVTTLVSARLAGADIVMILGMVPTFVDHIITQPNTRPLTSSRGKSVASTALAAPRILAYAWRCAEKASIRRKT